MQCPHAMPHVRTVSAAGPLPRGQVNKVALDVLRGKDKLHVEFKWNPDTGARTEGSRCQLSVTVYFVSQFAALRQLYCGGDDIAIIRSLVCD